MRVTLYISHVQQTMILRTDDHHSSGTRKTERTQDTLQCTNSLTQSVPLPSKNNEKNNSKKKRETLIVPHFAVSPPVLHKGKRHLVCFNGDLPGLLTQSGQQSLLAVCGDSLETDMQDPSIPTWSQVRTLRCHDG